MTTTLNQLTTNIMKNNDSVNQFISNLNGSTFSFDFGSPDNSIPLNILTTTYDLNNCISKCSNNGKCKFIDNTFKCICDADFSGSKCELDQRPCSNDIQCLNSIKCENILNETKPNSNGLYLQNYYDYKCHCKENFIGRKCEMKINICDNETCSGNGICSIQNENKANETIECKCFGTGLYEGKYCQLKTTKKKVIEVTTRTTYYIAIVVLVSLYTIAVLSDLHSFYASKKNKTVSRPKKESKIKKDRKIKNQSRKN